MSSQFAVLAFLALISTTGVMAVRLDCSTDDTDCILYDVQTNGDNEIEFPQSFNRALAQKLTKIEIKRSKFPYFPGNFFKAMPNVKFLTARDCGIVTLDVFGLHSSYTGTGIVTLNLEYNLAETLEAYAFHRTRNLLTLELSNNLLTHIHALAFYGLSQLEILNLADNQLVYLDQSVFTPLISLMQLYLGSNQLQVLNLDIFHGNVKLDLLFLAANELSTLQATFVNKVIDYIDLSGNQLVDISALGKMKGMHSLILSDNKEVNLIADDFAEMEGLNSLQLEGVGLQHRLNNNNQFLKPLQQLWSLHIGRNNLTSLSQLSHPIISELVVDRNEISELDVNALKAKLPELTDINISNNPWKCQVLTKVLDQLKKLEIELIFRGGNFPVPPMSSKSVKSIICDHKNVSPNLKFNGDISVTNIDER
jgi:Leucine rich repeat